MRNHKLFYEELFPSKYYTNNETGILNAAVVNNIFSSQGVSKFLCFNCI